MTYRDETEAKAAAARALATAIRRLSIDPLASRAVARQLARAADGVEREIAPRRWSPQLVELIAVTVLLVFVYGLYVVFIAHGCHLPNAESVRTDALAVRSAVELYVAQRPNGPCPTMADLTRERILSASTRTDDPWGEPFRIVCNGEHIDVGSTGPDLTPGTDDDVRLGKTP